MMSLMMFVPIIVGAIATLVAGWSGFIETAFMNMTLTLEGFDYGFGPAQCGEWAECGNATFDVYVQSRNLAIALFIIALVVVAIKEMLSDGFGLDISLSASDTKTLPQLLQYSVLVFAFLFIFPPMWDVAAGAMNNVGLWVLNPYFDHVGHTTHGDMCRTDISYDALLDIAPYVRDWDAWSVYTHGDRPLRDGIPSTYEDANNYVINESGVISKACLNADLPNSDAACAGVNVNRPSDKSDTEIGEILCNPDLRVKYVFKQALAVTETEPTNAEELLGAVTGTGGDDIMVAIFTQLLKGSTTLQVIMVVFMTGVMVDVVTAFALAIIPVVFFYRFLPFSSRVQLGDYSGAAFALLAMPLIAGILVVAGSGAVSVMAADAEDFASFFVWLAALSVILLVIGIPATMVPLIGVATQQATAAVQTGVQTAQFGATVIGSAAAGGIQGMRQGRSKTAEFAKLQAMGTLEGADRTRYDQLKSQGFDGRFGTARSAFAGAGSGARGQILDEKGGFSSGLKSALHVDPSSVTSKAQMVTGGGFADQGAGSLGTSIMDAGTRATETAIRSTRWDQQQEEAERERLFREADAARKAAEHTLHEQQEETIDRLQNVPEAESLVNASRARRAAERAVSEAESPRGKIAKINERLDEYNLVNDREAADTTKTELEQAKAELKSLKEQSRTMNDNYRRVLDGTAGRVPGEAGEQVQAEHDALNELRATEERVGGSSKTPTNKD